MRRFVFKNSAYVRDFNLVLAYLGNRFVGNICDNLGSEARITPSSTLAVPRVKMAKKKSDDKNNENTKNEGDSSSNDEDPNFSDPEGYVDDISEEGNSRKIPSLFDI